MLAFLVEECRMRGVANLKGNFRPTAKNGPAADFYPRHGFECLSTGEEGALWTLDVARTGIECPPWIRLIRSGRTALREYATP